MIKPTSIVCHLSSHTRTNYEVWNGQPTLWQKLYGRLLYSLRKKKGEWGVCIWLKASLERRKTEKPWECKQPSDYQSICPSEFGKRFSLFTLETHNDHFLRFVTVFRELTGCSLAVPYFIDWIGLLLHNFVVNQFQPSRSVTSPIIVIGKQQHLCWRAHKRA